MFSLPAHLTLALVTLTMAAEVVLPVFVVSTSEARVDLSRVVCTLAGVVVFEFGVIAETLFAALLAFVGPLVLVDLSRVVCTFALSSLDATTIGVVMAHAFVRTHEPYCCSANFNSLSTNCFIEDVKSSTDDVKVTTTV